AAVLASACRSRPSPTHELVDRDGEDHEDACHQILVDDLDADERQSVAEDADDDCADEGSEHTPSPAEEARAAEYDGGDGVQVLRCLTRVRIAELRACCEEHRSDPDAESRGDVHAERDPAD